MIAGIAICRVKLNHERRSYTQKKSQITNKTTQFCSYCFYCTWSVVVLCQRLNNTSGVNQSEQWGKKNNNVKSYYRGSPHSTNFGLQGNRTIAKIVLNGDWFSTKITIYDFSISKVPFLALLYKICPFNLTISSFSYSVSCFWELFAAFIKKKCCKSL